MVEKLLKSQPAEYSVLYLDMDSFFASVEQQFDARLRARPVAVCPCASDSTSVVAASIEAKKRGIRTGMKVYRARRLCPELIVVSTKPALYRQIHYGFMEVLDSTLGLAVSKGIDEAYVLIPSYLRDFGAALDMAVAIKSAITSKLGSHIGCSIGIAPNIWLAKMAASFNKPNGLFILELDRLAWFYSRLNLLDFTGINWRLARRFYNLGIYSPSQLYAAPYAFMKHYFGVNGQKWYLRLRGHEVDNRLKIPARSIGHQVTLPPVSRRDPAVIRATLIKICCHIGYRMRHSGLKSRLMLVGLFYADRTYLTKMIYLERPTWTDSDLASPQLLETVARLTKGKTVRKLSITMLRLAVDRQLALFGQDELKKNNLSTAIDRINGSYGPDTIGPAAVLGRSAMHDQIGFGNF